MKKLKRGGKKAIIVCSSGISCSVYGDIKAQTVHSCYGLQTADMSSHMVVERSSSLPHCMQKIKAADTIIWDEAGMSSKRTLELINVIHHIMVADQNNRAKPFGGKQVILVGEFMQLRPVPSIFDDGDFMFQSYVFNAAIAHKFELTQLLRQDSASPFFSKPLGNLDWDNVVLTVQHF